MQERSYSPYLLIFFIISIPILSGAYTPSSSKIISHHSQLTLYPHQNEIFYVGGSGPNNYSSIQQAINNATSGDTIFVYNGTYSEYITINKTLTIKGEATNLTKVVGNGTGILIRIQSDYTVLKHFTINQADIGIQINSSHITLAHNLIIKHDLAGINLQENTQDIIIFNSTFTQIKTQAIDLKSTETNSIYNNYFINNDNQAIKGENTFNTSIQNNIFEYNKIGITLRTCKNIIIQQNTIKKNQYPITLDTTNNTIIQNNTINSHSRGIKLYNAHYNKIRYNSISNHDNYAIQVQHYSSNNQITNNTIMDNNDTGISIHNSNYTSIYHNFITQSYQAISVENHASYNTIGSNNISNNYIGINLDQTTNTEISTNHIMINTYGVIAQTITTTTFIGNSLLYNQKKGIQITANANQIQLNNNLIKQNRDGIFIRTSNQINCIGNTIIQQLNNGIWVENTSDITIITNHFEFNTNGIYFSHSQQGLIQSNTIIQNLQNGINLWFSSKIEIYQNNITKNKVGIKFISSHDNRIIENIIINQIEKGIFSQSYNTNNTFYHNNFVNNPMHAYDTEANIWNFFYPSGGNYWDDYTGTDSDNDGIGDSPYNIPGGLSQDKYPLMNLYTPKNLTVSLTKGFGLQINVHNLGPTPLYQVTVDIKISGGIFQLIDKQISTTFSKPIEENKSKTKHVFPFGIGPIMVHINATALNIPTTNHSFSGIIFLFFTR